MSSQQTHTYASIAESPQLACPDCAAAISVESPICHSCGFEASLRHGIVSLRTDRNGRRSGRDPRALDDLAALVEERPIREATTAFLEAHEVDSSLVDELYDVQRDSWQALVGERVSGRCLDLNAGFGRRSMLLAELAETVYAVDSSLPKLRIAAARDDYDSSDRVVPVHTTEERLPIASNSVETIVADLTTAHDQDDRTRLSRLREFLTDDGTLLCIADGWTRKAGLTALAGLEQSRPNDPSKFRPGTAEGYRSLAREVGFDHVSVYALFPTAARPLYVFDVENEHAVRTLADSLFGDGGRRSRLGKRLLTLGDRCGVLPRWYPSYLVVCTDSADVSARGTADALVTSGRARSVALETSADGVERVRKVPNRETHVPFTARENAILAYLGKRDAPITDTLPVGDHLDSRFGTARVERPVEGEPLGELLTDDAESFGRALRLGFDWLASFQQEFGGETVVRSPADVREDLRFEPTGIEPPPVDEPVETFFTPVHGDFMSQNVYLKDGAVTAVIDWEYGAVEANPVIDAGFFLLEAASQVAGGARDGYTEVLCGETAYTDYAVSCANDYCDAVGIPRRTFEHYFPAVYLHRLALDWQFDAVSTYTTRMSDRSRLVEYLFERRDQFSLG